MPNLNTLHGITSGILRKFEEYRFIETRLTYLSPLLSNDLSGYTFLLNRSFPMRGISISPNNENIRFKQYSNDIS
jgi:hypothetical protein